jgi:primosomal protein N' (replication factor Y)
MASYLEVVFNLPLNKSFTYLKPAALTVEAGYRVIAPFGRRKLVGYVIAVGNECPPGIDHIKEVERCVDKRVVFDDSTLGLAEWLARMYMCSLGKALSSVLPGGRREIDLEDIELDFGDKKKVDLTGQQAQAIDKISAAGSGFFYLYGVTGSGKTEVFLRAAENMINKERGVIYLVPEISLTHQVYEEFSAVFGSRVGVLHSGLTPSQRLKEWYRVLDGEVRLVIGARSAVFAPVKNLGLVIVDEEHENSYKAGSTPRYHARQVAMYRSKAEKAVLVMGSATPSVEAYYRMQSGKLECLPLSRRLGGGDIPQIVVLDLKGEKRSLSKPLIREIRRTHSEGRQTILFLNRRGFAYYFYCRSCGFEMKCKNCSVSLTFHKDRNRMICHYCGYQDKPVKVCPECSSIDVGYSGFGTERIEEEIEQLFPDLVVRRVDTDAVRKKKILRELLVDFGRGKIDILLGTQMVAKGLNFPGVKLVGIVSADTGLQLPDFRAAERTFNLIVQVSGRAGRRIPDGKVVIQTFKPQNEVIRMAAEGRLEDFYTKEIEVRQELDFPPFSRLIRLVFRGRDSNKTRNAASAFISQMPESSLDRVSLLGPAECPLAMISGSYRYHLIFRSQDFSALHNMVQSSVAAYKAPPCVYIEVDVDPVSLL